MSKEYREKSIMPLLKSEWRRGKNDRTHTKTRGFCFAYIETGNASEAYRQAYETEDMKSETVHRKAKELMDNGKITARIEELKAEHAERHKLTVDDL